MKYLTALWSAATTRIAAKFMIPIILVVGLGVVAAGVVVSMRIGDDVRQAAQEKAQSSMARFTERMQAINRLRLQMVRSGIRALKDEAQQLGTPALRGRTSLEGKAVPNLQFGRVSQVGRYQLPDQVTEQLGGTATLFARDGDTFVRVSTNVTKDDGSRAVGTVLNPDGKAYAAITDGESYYGIVDILGDKYLTGYEPMRDAQGDVVGIWYVGYELSGMTALQASVQETRILENGFLAVLDEEGEIMFNSKHISPNKLQSALASEGGSSKKGSSKGKAWNVRRSTFEAWGFTIVAAYPDRDINAQLTGVRRMIFLFGSVVLVIIAGILYMAARRTVIGPIQELATAADAAADGDYSVHVEHDTQDEVGRLAASFNTMVRQIQEAMTQMEEKSEAARKAAREAKDAKAKANEQRAYLSENIETMLEAMNRFADGDLTVRARLEDGDGDLSGQKAMMDRLFEEFNQAVRSIRRLLSDVKEAAEETASSAVQISTSSDQMAASAEEQSAQSEEVAAAVEELNQTIGENAKSVQSVAEAAGEGSRQARNGQEVVSEATAKIKEIAADVQDTAETIGRLQDSSEQISTVVETIDEIAGQTNLLALNAAIEAARAGGDESGAETGQGFAVVAEEVRELADETDQATSEISSIIGEVQSEIEEAVQAARRSSQNAKDGIDLSEKASETLGEIVSSIERVEQKADEIAAASEEQSTTSEEIAQSVQSISTAAQQSAVGVAQVSEAAGDLDDLTDRLREGVERFALEEQSRAGRDSRPADHGGDGSLSGTGHLEGKG
ncbi:methyl-accepting chemotaxis protein [Salinibacter ruber]|uniref:methyl-accepting chemotaxis protein n=1 Tax=Salinibacter ruber TaxID=146919 RepID=UPI002169F096|nr:Cache 3/Cache 2 fusion domain-containing protein [Salinibacter ruber]MCS4194229.1 methyl-accepting chemotaxis protein [Salinibacter ruber]